MSSESMRVSELCERTGVPLSSIKFYIREGLLERGARTGPNQARYGQRHVERVSLIRALRDVAGLSIEVVHTVLTAIDEAPRGDSDPVHEALSAVYPDDAADDETLRNEVAQVLRAQPWTTSDERHFYLEQIVGPLAQLQRYLHPDFNAEYLAPLAQVAWKLSEIEYANDPAGGGVPTAGSDPTEAVKRAVLGTLLLEPIILALRRNANAARGQRLFHGLPVPPADLE